MASKEQLIEDICSIFLLAADIIDITEIWVVTYIGLDTCAVQMILLRPDVVRSRRRARRRQTNENDDQNYDCQVDGEHQDARQGH